MINAGIYPRGATINFLAGVTLGSVGDITGTPTCDVKPMSNGAVPGDDVAALFSASVVAAAATDTTPAGYTVTITDEQSEALAMGSYCLDIRAVVGSGIYQSEPVSFRIANRVTAP